ncbi:alanyl-tRNA editing protein [Pseudothermotoga sp.]
MIKIKRLYEEGKDLFAVSDESPFYPDGKGGQLGDRGSIGPAKVLYVKEVNGEVHHKIDKPIEPREYDFEIDQARRKDIATQHTAQHILSAAFLKIAQAQTVSFHMGEETSTIDTDLAVLTERTVEDVEKLANEVVKSCVDVEILLVDREEAERLNLRKAISEKVGQKVRIVKIQDFDLSACGGFHVKNTGEIGIIKIVDWEKVKQNLTRVHFVAGERALKHFQECVTVTKSLQRTLTCSLRDLPIRIEALIEKIKSVSSLLDRISEEHAQLIAANLPRRKIFGYEVAFYEGFPSVAKALLKQPRADLLVCKLEEEFALSSDGIDCGQIVSKLRSILNVPGGGGKKRGSVKINMDMEEFLNLLEKALEVEK